jgi:hypothetical protein
MNATAGELLARAEANWYKKGSIERKTRFGTPNISIPNF